MKLYYYNILYRKEVRIIRVMRKFGGMKKKPPLVIPERSYSKDQKTVKSVSIEIYEDTESYNFKEVLRNISVYCADHDTQYAIMRHDQDIYNEDTFSSDHRLLGRKGEKKRIHYHVNLWFKNRVALNDICIAFGIDDRWIKILKKDRDFDNILVYCTHIKFDESVKHHYSVDDYTTNIGDYIRMLYDKTVNDILADHNNIYSVAVDLLNANDNYRMSYQEFVTSLFQMGCQLDDIRYYYQMLKDLLIEHNTKCDLQNTLDLAHMSARMEADLKIKDQEKNISKLCDTFGATKIVMNNEEFIVQKLKKGKK